MRGEAGLLNFKSKKKICLVTRIMNQDNEEDTYAKEILKEQIAMEWEGLAKEVLKFCQEVGLSNPCEQFLNREEVSGAVMYSHL